MFTDGFNCRNSRSVMSPADIANTHTFELVLLTGYHLVQSGSTPRLLDKGGTAYQQRRLVYAVVCTADSLYGLSWGHITGKEVEDMRKLKKKTKI